MNPVRAGLVTQPEEWPCSSAAIHVRGATLPGVDYPASSSLLSWCLFLGQPETPGVEEQLRAHTYGGRPIGAVVFSSDSKSSAVNPLSGNREGVRQRIPELITSDPNYLQTRR